MKFYFFITIKGFRFAAAKRPSCFSKKKKRKAESGSLSLAIRKFIENIEIDSVKLKIKLRVFIYRNMNSD